MVVRPDESGDGFGVGATNDRQLDCAALMFEESRPSWAHGDGLHLNVGIASDPAIESPVDQQDRCVAQPALRHGAGPDRVVVRFLVLYSSDPTAICRRRGAGPDDRYRAASMLC